MKTKTKKRIETRRAEHPVLEDMTPELKGIYKEARKQYDGYVRGEMNAKYEVGKLVNQVEDDETKYGKEAVKKLAQALGLSDDSLYSWGNVAKCYSESEFEKLLARRNQGFRLTFTHLIRLSCVNGSVERNRLVERAFKERMTTSELAEELRQLFMGPGKVQTVGPAKPRAGLKSMICFAKNFLESCEGLEEAFAGIDEIEPKKVAEHLELVREAQDKEEAMLERLQANLRELEKARTTLEKKLAEEKAKDRSPQTPTRRKKVKAA